MAGQTPRKECNGGSRSPDTDPEGPLMDSDTQAPSGALAAHTADRAPKQGLRNAPGHTAASPEGLAGAPRRPQVNTPATSGQRHAAEPENRQARPGRPRCPEQPAGVGGRTPDYLFSESRQPEANWIASLPCLGTRLRRQLQNKPGLGVLDNTFHL